MPSLFQSSGHRVMIRSIPQLNLKECRLVRSCSIALSCAIAALFAFLVFVDAPTAVAQTFRGSIQGTITDSTGAAVAGAQVKVFSTATGLSRTVIANDRGEYAASELPLGTYSVTVEKQGFRTTTLTQIPVSVGSPTRADVKLDAGAVQEVVEVNADVPLVETSSNTTGGTIEANEASELPVNDGTLQSCWNWFQAQAAILWDRPNRPARTVCSAWTAIAAAQTTICSTAPT